MKKIILIFSVLLGISFLISCEKDMDNPTLDMTQAQAPAFQSPGDGGDFVLLEENAEDFAAEFSWTPAVDRKSVV